MKYIDKVLMVCLKPKVWRERVLEYKPRLLATDQECLPINFAVTCYGHAKDTFRNIKNMNRKK